MWGYGPYSRMMDGWDWIMPFPWIFPILFFVLLAAIVVFLARYSSRVTGHSRRLKRESASLDILEERYARGEINRDEFLQKRGDILG